MKIRKQHAFILGFIAVLGFMQTGCVGTMMGMTVGSDFEQMLSPVDNKIYAGVRFDAKRIGQYFSKDDKPSPIAYPLFPLLIVDLPLSFAADTVLLPYTIPDAMINE